MFEPTGKTSVTSRLFSNGPVVTILLSLLLLFAVWRRWNRGSQQHHGLSPPQLRETIPYVSNAFQFMTNKKAFIARATEALEKSPGHIIQYQLGPMKMYLMGNATTNVHAAIFRSAFTADPWILRIMENAGYQPSDLATLSADTTGNASVPYRPRRRGSDIEKDAPTKNQPQQQERVWYPLHKMYDENLVSAKAVDKLAPYYQTFWIEQLPSVEQGWIEDVKVGDFIKSHMTHAATKTIFGSLILEVNPGFVDAFWGFEKHVETLTIGLPDWLNQPAIRGRNKFRGMCRKWFELADTQYDWTRSDTPDWEPVFGSGVAKGLAGWAKSLGFKADTMGPLYILFFFGLHANPIPIGTWMVMELLKDPALLQAVKEEVSQCYLDDDPKRLDHRKLQTMPLLQSIHAETLRLHMGVLLTRTCTEDVTIAGYTFPKGSVFQAPTEVGHLDETVWGAPGHPASDFWAYRHTKEVTVPNEKTGEIKKQLQFSMDKRSGSFFPYGGGGPTCPGRNFAKAELFLTVGVLVSRVEMEFVEWLNPDGSHSDRAPSTGANYANAVAAGPDRDVKVRWRRVW
ncbi:cytochrome P450 [Podospora australis]|uniref:Cytochrome P450 n=1 Tax=Podospora australis TaxID=1536484 RepID=A0AAN7AFC0_9PEZI|nr:cytochrome P450 [Podospora australis]